MSFLKNVFNEFSKDNCTTLAAAIAYYTVFSLPPMLYLLATVLTYSLSLAYDTGEAQDKARSLLERQAADLIGNPAASQEISAILTNNDEIGGAWWKTTLSLGAILIGATGVVGAVQISLNRVWGVQPDPERSAIRETIVKRILSFGMILMLGFLSLVSFAVSAILSSVGERVGSYVGMGEFAAESANYCVQAAVILAMFTAILKVMPDADIRWRDAALGALITTALFIAGRYLMQLYFSLSEPGAHLGSAAASLAVILVWVYYSAMILLLGAEATQVYATRFGVGIHPEKGAVRVVQTIERV